MANNKDFKVKNGIQPTAYHEGLGTVTSGMGAGFNLSATTYDNKSFASTSQETFPLSIFLKPDGTKLYILGTGSDSVYQYSLSTAWDISTASYDSKSLDVSGVSLNSFGIFFKSDGSKMFFVSGADTVVEYDLSTDWDISTGTKNSNSLDLTTNQGSTTDCRAITFDNSGSKLFVVDRAGTTADTIYQYSLTTAWDVSTASYDSKSFNVTSQSYDARTCVFNTDGTKMYHAHFGEVHQYTLTTAFDISTASYDSVETIVLKDQGTFVGADSIRFSADGTKLYALDSGSDTIFQYSTAPTTNTLDLSTGSVFEITPTSDIEINLSNPAASGTVSQATLLLDGAASEGWDIENAVSTSNTFVTTSQDTQPKDVVFNTDGTKMYIIGDQNNSIFQYSLTTAYDPSTATYDSKSMSVSSQTTGPESFCFADSGTKVYVAGDSTDTIYQYNLTTAYDISTGSYASKSLSVSTQDTAIRGVRIKNDGTSIYVNGTNSWSIYQYNLTTAYDLSTASYASKSFNFSSQDLNSRGFFFKYDGTKMYIHGSDGDDISSYSLSTAWDVSTASFDSVSLSVATGVCGVNASDDGVYLYTVDEDDDTINQYSMGVAATITYPSTLEWPSGTAPTSPAIGDTDILTFSTRDGGTSYQAVQAINGAK